MAKGLTATVTITGVVGPGDSVSATKLTSVTSWNVDCINNTLTVFYGNNQVQAFDISAETTLTWTVSGNTYTLTIAA